MFSDQLFRFVWGGVYERKAVTLDISTCICNYNFFFLAKAEKSLKLLG